MNEKEKKNKTKQRYLILVVRPELVKDQIEADGVTRKITELVCLSWFTCLGTFFRMTSSSGFNKSC